MQCRYKEDLLEIVKGAVARSSFSAIREERRKIVLKEEFLNATKERGGHVDDEEESGVDGEKT